MKTYYDPMYGGTEQWHRLNAIMPNLIASQSVVDTCREKQMFWTVDVVISHVLTNKKVSADDFIVCFFDVKDGKCSFKMTDGNDKVLCRQRMEYTDAEGSVKYYAIREGQYIKLIFPSDY
jgi:hypothetical protein